MIAAGFHDGCGRYVQGFRRINQSVLIALRIRQDGFRGFWRVMPRWARSAPMCCLGAKAPMKRRLRGFQVGSDFKKGSPFKGFRYHRGGYAGKLLIGHLPGVKPSVGAHGHHFEV